jgi:Uma2 family endonuclease
MTASTGLLPLESGDRLTREEFHRRYCAHPEIKRAELVEGIVYVDGRVTLAHGEAHAAMSAWLGMYGAYHPDTRAGDSATVLLDETNELQPDVLLMRSQPFVNTDGYVEGAPELVVEVAARSASYDLFEKKRAYERNGVQEYIVWQTKENRLDWFRLTGGQYIEVAPDAAGIIESSVFPGLRLDVPALLAGEFGSLLG